MNDAIHIGRAPDVLHPAQHTMNGIRRGADLARALLAMVAMLAHPCVPEHLLAETAAPGLAAPVMLRVRTAGIPRIMRRVRRRAERLNGCNSMKMINKMFHLFFFSSRRRHTR